MLKRLSYELPQLVKCEVLPFILSRFSRVLGISLIAVNGPNGGNNHPWLRPEYRGAYYGGVMSWFTHDIVVRDSNSFRNSYSDLFLECTFGALTYTNGQAVAVRYIGNEACAHDIIIERLDELQN